MREKPAPNAQLRLKLPVRNAATMSAEMERYLITALADLLVAVATGGETATEGGRDEREDP
jgi:hypothetical protein